MTKADFIASVEAKPNFIKWAKLPEVAERIGDVEKWNGIAYINTTEGYTNTFNVWFIVDTATGNATWQTIDTLEPNKNATQVAINALTTYLKSNFAAYFLIPGKADVVNKWAEAEVFIVSGNDLVRKNVIVYKQGTNPITHKVIV